MNLNLKEVIFVCLFYNALQTQPYLANDQIRHLVHKSEKYYELYLEYSKSINN